MRFQASKSLNSCIIFSLQCCNAKYPKPIYFILELYYKAIYLISYKQVLSEDLIRTYVINNTLKTVDASVFLENIRDLITDKIKEQLNNKDFKINLVLLANNSRGTGNNIEYMEMNFKTENVVLLKTTDMVD